MKFLDQLTLSNSFIGLSSLDVASKPRKEMYKGICNSSFFKFDIKKPIADSIYIIDQTACHHS